MKPSLSSEDAQFLRWLVEDDDVYMTPQQADYVEQLTVRGLVEEHPIDVPCVCGPTCTDTIIALVCRHTDKTRLALLCYDIWAKEKGL